MGPGLYPSLPSVDDPSGDGNVDDEQIPIILRFSLKYRPIHGWLIILVCGLGLITNMLTIVVFTRAKLRRSPTSLILVSIAASDLLVMLSTIVFVIYFYIIHGDLPSHQLSPQRDTWAWIHFSNAHVLLTFTAHSISIWLNVYLACFRFYILFYLIFCLLIMDLIEL